MERVTAGESRQRTGEGVSPVVSKCSEDHSGVAALKGVQTGKSSRKSPLKDSCIGRGCPYNVTGGIANVNKPSSFYKRAIFLWAYFRS